jgi:hypothetical protein
MTTQDTDKDIEEMVYSSLTKCQIWAATNTASDGILGDQTRLGWSLLTEGRFSIEWRCGRQIYYDRRGRRRGVHRWASSLEIRHWHIGWEG